MILIEIKYPLFDSRLVYVSNVQEAYLVSGTRLRIEASLAQKVSDVFSWRSLPSDL